MFALEIDFHDGVSAPETLLVRRPHAVIGASEVAHVVIEGAASSLPEFCITRGIGPEFRCQLLGRSAVAGRQASFIEGVYQGFASLSLGEVTTNITSLDSDLISKPSEPPDEAGIRIMRSSLAKQTPMFPALAVLGSMPILYSFSADSVVVIGRSRRCGLRIDAASVASEHAKIWQEKNVFYLENLAEPHKTTIGRSPVEGSVQLGDGETIVLGGEAAITLIRRLEELTELNRRVADLPRPVAPSINYPCIVSRSPLVRPGRFCINNKSKVSIGRDPASDIWIGAAHISHHHLDLRFEADRVVAVDCSTNGTIIDGTPLVREEHVELQKIHHLVDLQGGIELKICFAEDDEAGEKQKHAKPKAASETEKVQQEASDEPEAREHPENKVDTEPAEIGQESTAEKLPQNAVLGPPLTRRAEEAAEAFGPMPSTQTAGRTFGTREDDEFLGDSTSMNSFARLCLVLGVTGLFVVVGVLVMAFMVN